MVVHVYQQLQLILCKRPTRNLIGQFKISAEPRNSEVVAALGMSEDVAKSQNKLNDEVLEKQTEAAESC